MGEETKQEEKENTFVKLLQEAIYTLIQENKELEKQIQQNNNKINEYMNKIEKEIVKT